MSVINTMLRDLEQREGQTLSGRYQPPAPRRWSLLIGAALSLLIVVPTLAYWLWPGEGPSAEPVAAGPVVHSVPLAEKIAPLTVAPAPSAAVASSAVVVTSAGVAPSATEVSSAVAPTASQAPSGNSPARAAVVAAVALESSESSSPQEPAASEDVDDALLGPDEGPQPTEAAELVDASDMTVDEAPQGTLEIAEEHLSPQQEAALERRKGLQAISKRQLDVARDAFGQVLANDPLDHEIRERLAGLFYGEGRLPEAQQVLADGIRLAPAQY